MLTHVDWCIRPQGKHRANLIMKVSQGTEPSLAPTAARTGSPHGISRPGTGPGEAHGAGQRISGMQQSTFRKNMRYEANFVDVGTVHEFQRYINHFGVESPLFLCLHDVLSSSIADN